MACMRALIVALATLAAASAHADWFGTDCPKQAERSAAQPAAGVTKVVIVGRAGFLHIEGHPGAGEVKANGTACASMDEQLAGVLLKGSRSGSEVRIEAVMPNQEGSWFSSSPKLDFTVSLPAGVAVDVVDSSGELTISNVGDAKVEDSSGSIDIRKVAGNLSVRDSSGEIDIEDVSGDVRIPDDGSGSIHIERVGGSVTIDEDGSGSIEVRDVKRNVTIGTDGSGSIEVADVGGDFNVGSKGSGSVDYERVRGRVAVPDRHRR